MVKNIVLLFGLVMLTSLGYSQVYEVTPDGLKDKFAHDNNYVVIGVSYKNADELFKNAMEFVDYTFDNPKQAVIKKVDDKLLLIKNTAPQFMKIEKNGVDIDISASYEIELKIKDNKVRYEIKNLEMKADDSRKDVLFNDKERRTFAYQIYKKESLNLPNTKTDIEKYFNNELNEVKRFLEGKGSSDDDW